MEILTESERERNDKLMLFKFWPFWLEFINKIYTMNWLRWREWRREGGRWEVGENVIQLYLLPYIERSVPIIRMHISQICDEEERKRAAIVTVNGTILPYIYTWSQCYLLSCLLSLARFLSTSSSSSAKNNISKEEEEKKMLVIFVVIYMRI